jgi:hypothetical protein
LKGLFYRGDNFFEFYVELFEYRKKGVLDYSHPNGTQDGVGLDFLVDCGRIVVIFLLFYEFGFFDVF